MTLLRRRVVLGTLATAGLAGCLDGTGNGTDDEADTNQPSSPETDGDGSTSTPGPSTGDSSPTQTPDDDSTTTPADSTPTPPGDEKDDVFPGYELTTIAVRTPGEELLGWVRAAIADTQSLRYTGLSETDALPENYGMLFVFDDVDERTFVMREMDFGIDIVYADDERRITAIHHAPEPGSDEDGGEQRYRGRGQYVLEVQKHWTTDRGVEKGDVLDFDLSS